MKMGNLHRRKEKVDKRIFKLKLEMLQVITCVMLEMFIYGFVIQRYNLECQDCYFLIFCFSLSTTLFFLWMGELTSMYMAAIGQRQRIHKKYKEEGESIITQNSLNDATNNFSFYEKEEEEEEEEGINWKKMKRQRIILISLATLVMIFLTESVMRACPEIRCHLKPSTKDVLLPVISSKNGKSK